MELGLGYLNLENYMKDIYYHVQPVITMAQRLFWFKNIYKNILDGLNHEQSHGTWNAMAII